LAFSVSQDGVLEGKLEDETPLSELAAHRQKMQQLQASMLKRIDISEWVGE
jgi:hypothetical protein